MKTTEQITLDQFIKDNQITMTCQRTDENPNFIDDKFQMYHWKCVIKRPMPDAKAGEQCVLRTIFSMGLGHKGKQPKLDEVLDCLANDADGVIASLEPPLSWNTFEDWCSEYGYDTDSRKAERTYKVCQKQAIELLAFLDNDLYATLLHGTERL